MKPTYPTFNALMKESSDLISSAAARGERALDSAIDNFWNILEHPDFPFVSLTSTTNAFRNFPAYNIIEGKDGKVRLEMAVAGYTKDRIKVEKEGNTLIIQGKPAEVAVTEDVRHRSISNAAWLRTFDMAPGAEIGDVQLKDGILTVFVNKPTPAQPPRTAFEIK